MAGGELMKRNRIIGLLTCSILVLVGIFSPAIIVNAAPLNLKTHAIFLPMVVGGSNTASSAFPSLDQFIVSLENSQPDEIKGIYVNAEFALQVIQQPADNYTYISTKPNIVTQYSLAAKLGVIGLLAHNNLAGKNFFLLKTGETVTLVYGDGSTMTVRVTAVDRYQALEPTSSYSALINLDDGEELDSAQVFQKYYTQENAIVFQTCITQDGQSSWGRLFIVAEPAA